MNIAITGASGFIGRLLTDELYALGDKVVRLSRTAGDGDSVIKGDLTDESCGLDDFVANAEVIYHCAGEVKNPKLMYPLHVKGTANLLAAVQRRIRRDGKPVHWIQLSSTGAYGKQGDRTIVDESFQPEPVGEYEVTKTIADELVLAMAKSEPLFTCTLIRPSIVLGASMPNQSFFQLAMMVRKKMFFYIGNRSINTFTYVHVDDVVRALIACGRDPRAVGETFILSADCLQQKVIQAIAEWAGVSEPVFGFPEKLLRLLIGVIPSRISLPLTKERIDALTKTGGFDSRHIGERLDFKFLHDIPQSVPAILAGKQNDRSNQG